MKINEHDYINENFRKSHEIYVYLGDKNNSTQTNKLISQSNEKNHTTITT